MRIESGIEIRRDIDAVFDYLTDPTKLHTWQPSTVEVRRDRSGPLQEGERFVEVHALGPRKMESTVAVVGYDRPRRFALDIVEGPMPLDGRWTLEQTAAGTRVSFVGDARLTGFPRLLAPLLRPALSRQFRGYHARLKRALEGSGRG